MLSIPDMAILGAFALIFFGPDQLPKVARKAGQVMRDVQNTSQSFLREMERAADDSELPRAYERPRAYDIPHAEPETASEPDTSPGDSEQAAHSESVPPRVHDSSAGQTPPE